MNPPVSASVGIQIMAVLVVGALWLLLWQVTMAKRRDAARAEPSSPEPSASDQDPDALVAVTANGWGFTTDGDEVHLVPPAGLVGATGLWEGVGPGLPTGAAPEAGHDSGERLPAAVRTGEHLAPGDLGAAQLLPGDAAGLTWWLEALGRGGDYRAWPFEGEETARRALALLEERVVRPPRDERGAARPPGPEDFERARRDLELSLSPTRGKGRPE